MERLTYYSMKGSENDGWYLKPGVTREVALYRLAAYESTGLTPEEVKLISNVLRAVGEEFNCRTEYVGTALVELAEYKKAESEGRLVVLPCKVGDTVYRICHEYKQGNPFIRAVTFNRNNFWRIVFGGEIGKTVFLTRKEAEAAMRGGSDG